MSVEIGNLKTETANPEGSAPVNQNAQTILPLLGGEGRGEGVPAKPPDKESSAMGISIRAWLAVILVLTVCLMSGLEISVTEPLYTISIMSVSFYFGQIKQPAKT